jgi:rhomboid protease GluP
MRSEEPMSAATTAIHHIGPVPKSKLGEWSLVLRSQEITHGLSAQPDGFYVTVQDRDVDRSVHALRAYEEENRDFRPPRVREKLPFESSLAAPILMAVMAFFFLVTGPVALRSAWFLAGTADATRILSDEPWRAITALTLHADAGHVLGNVLAGAVFLSLLFRRLGPGRGAFLTLIAGALANVANAALHIFILHVPHRSIGASTAVFAAVGLLAATQITINRDVVARRWTDRVGPIVGGVALLGLLGSSGQSDLWAHFLGLAVGALLGVIVLLPKRARAPLGPRMQVLLGTISLALVIAAWAVAAIRSPIW